MATSWFIYNDSGSTSDPENYSEVGSTPSCPPGCCLCSLFAEIQIINGIPKPIITPSLQAEINWALSTCTNTPNVKVKRC